MRTEKKAVPVVTTMNVETTDFGIDPDVIPALFDNIYKNKVRTLTQEYMSNGRDANREVGQTKPIEVTLPTLFNPNLIIRDFGPGITPERMYGVFIRIGASTKRDTNTQTGGFGVGCKAYFSYGETFHVNTYIDGFKRSYTCWKDGDKKLHLDFHKEKVEETTEPNGTEIILPVNPRDIREFQTAVFRACYFWKESERPVIKGMDDQKQILFHTTGHKVGPVEFFDANNTPDYVIRKNYNTTEAFFVIDGISYPLNDGIKEKVPAIRTIEKMAAPGMSTMIHLNNGAVRVAISREDIDNSSKTVQSLNDILNLAIPKLEKDRESMLNYDSLASFLKAVSTARKIYNVETKKYKNFTYSGSIIRSDEFSKLLIIKKKIRGTKLNSDEMKYIEDSFINSDSFYYVDKSPDSQTITGRKIRQFLNTHSDGLVIFDAKEELKDSDGNVVMEAGHDFLKELISILDIKPLSSLNYIKPERNSWNSSSRSSKPSKQEVSLHIFTGSSKNVSRKELTSEYIKANQFVYIDLDNYGSLKDELYSIKYYLTHIHRRENTHIVAIPKGEMKKIEKLNNFISLEKFKENYEFSEKEITAHLLKNNLILNPMKWAKNLEIKNKKFLEIVEFYKEYGMLDEKPYSPCYGDDFIPSFIKNKATQDKKIKKFLEKDQEFARIIKEDYSLVLLFLHQGMSYLSSNQKFDLETYINNRE